jgi:serine/threonine protein phosphatase 1
MSFLPRFSVPKRPSPSIPEGHRVYAIGDVHGEAALFESLMSIIERDSVNRGSAITSIVLLGDVIDRGRRSADLLEILMRAEQDRLTILKGNHEAAFVAGYRGNERAFDFWLRHGGDTTLQSFGVENTDNREVEDLMEAGQTVISKVVIDWLDALPMTKIIGDYFFVHAGIRPGVDLEHQSADDLLWIREPFISSRRNHGKVVVHGHTVEASPVRLGGRRIGIDTGAYRTGVLTALGLQGSDQWTLQTPTPGVA